MKRIDSEDFEEEFYENKRSIGWTVRLMLWISISIYLDYSLVPGCSAMSPHARGFVDNNFNSDHCHSLCLHISDQVCTLDSLTYNTYILIYTFTCPGRYQMPQHWRTSESITTWQRIRRFLSHCCEPSLIGHIDPVKKSMRNSCVDINLFIFHVHVIIFTNSLKSIVSDLSVSICNIDNFIVGLCR